MKNMKVYKAENNKTNLGLKQIELKKGLVI